MVSIRAMIAGKRVWISLLFLFAWHAGFGGEFRLQLKSAGKRAARYFADHKLEQRDDDCEYAVIRVHGVKGGDEDCTKRLRELVARHTGNEHVLFIAPCFPIEEMLDEDEKSSILYWESGKWQRGYDSPVAAGVCVYDVLDAIFQSLNSPKLYPKLKHVLFCGYSAGGQTISRYVAVTNIKPRKGLDVDFAAGAPSTWLYLDNKRIDKNGIPKTPKDTGSRFDEWHLGLVKPCRYASSISQSRAIRNLAQRGLLCFCGTDDVLTADLTMSPGAMLQGKNRYERFKNYRAYIQRFPKLVNAVRFVEIPGAGHEGRCWDIPEVINLVTGKKKAPKAGADMKKSAPKAGAAPNPAKSGVDADVGRSWKKVSPEKHGYDSTLLDGISAFIKDRNMGTTGLMVVVGGEVIYEFGDVEEVSYIASCRKSILSMLYGKYVRNGTIDLNETIGDLGIDDVGGLLPLEKKAKVLDLLTARSGCYHPAANAGGIPDGKVLERGRTEPGTTFVYNNWDFNVAGTVFETKVGKSIYDVFAIEVAEPLQLQDWNRGMHRKKGDSSVSVHPAYHFHFSTRDMARIGQLMLRHGQWNGKQVIPSDWVTESTQPFTKFPEGGGYGYMWWCETDRELPDDFNGAFAAHGMYGQRISVFPALDMVVAHKSARNAKHPTKASDYSELVKTIIHAKVDKRNPANGRL